jgi:glucose/arabinose dehydrogenase
MKKLIVLLLLTCTLLRVNAQTPQLKLLPWVSGLVKPVEITHCGDSRVFILEQDGRIRIVANNSLLSVPFLDINPQVNSTGNEQGLLGLAFHPDYKTNGFFYINYTNNTGTTVISRFNVDPADSNRALIGSELILLTINQPYTNHNGGDLLFGKDGYLYIPLGDGGSAGDPQNFAQNRKSRLGKTIRIDVNYGNLFAIPPDNPFLNDTNYLPELWQLGLRNPWRCTVDPVDGSLWLADVGQGAFEEVNRSADGEGGQNFGWRCYEAANPYNTNGCQPASFYTDPVYAYPHVQGGQCSVTGGDVYRGALSSNLFGHYLFSDFCFPTLRTLKEDSTGAFIHQLNTAWPGAGISAFGSNQYGEMYVANLYNGEVRRLTDTSTCVPTAWLSDLDTLRICSDQHLLWTPLSDSMSYVWYRNNTLIPGINGNTFLATLNGNYRVEVTNLRNGCTNSAAVVLRLRGAQPVVNISGLDTLYCTSDPVAIMTGSPAGGVFSGLGVAGTAFNPGNSGTGTVLVQYTYTNPANGCVSKSIVPVKVSVCAGLEETSAFTRTNVFPNPARNETRVEFDLAESGVITIELMDLAGRLNWSERRYLSRGAQQVLLPLKGLASGMYLVRLTNGKGLPEQIKLLVNP